jgi:hypothetical protein
MDYLESRILPSVTFQFIFDQSFLVQFPSSAIASLELAGKVVGRSLGVDLVIPIQVYSASLLPAAVARGGGGVVIFDPTVPWHFGTTTVTLNSNQIDFFTVVKHELGHNLGVGTRENWQGNFPTASDGVHLAPGMDSVMASDVVVFGRRKLFTNTDYDILDRLGWKTVRPAQPEFAFVSMLGPDGRCRLYVFSREGVRLVADTGTFHVTFTDLDYDGTVDALITPIQYGYTIGYNRATGEIYFNLTLGQNLVVSYF